MTMMTNDDCHVSIEEILVFGVSVYYTDNSGSLRWQW